MVRLKGYLSWSIYRDKIISIPYGAIKRIKFSFFEQLKNGFQFLMVRLKVLVNDVDYLSARFQFLMVRLKVLEKIVNKIYHKFQFLMVRLKVIKRS